MTIPIFREGTGDTDVWSDVYEKNEYCLPVSLKKFVVLDIGCHIGSFSYSCLKREAIRVIAFDPGEENVNLTRLNCAEFGDRIEVVNQPVFGSVTTLHYPGFMQTPINTHTGGACCLYGEGLPVLSITLQSVINRISDPILIKMDCEGSEFDIIRNTHNWGTVQEIIGEYHELNYKRTSGNWELTGEGVGNISELLTILSNRGFNTAVDRGDNAPLGKFQAFKATTITTPALCRVLR